jgi:hypothetical protein
MAALKDPARHQECIRLSALRTNYGINGFGRRVPEEFERLLAKGPFDLGRA